MAKLNYKTQGGTSPQGKMRVYFSCHPEDLSPYFDQVADEILRRHDCSVWYDSDPDAAFDQEELMSDLVQMKLFVTPVTTRYLCRKNRARDMELSFAAEHHIPVLPLLMEPGLEAEFNAKCGELQCLDWNGEYAEKLTTYLKNILLGDELAAKVRAAFDAYVFLSYRKKDRKYARELMRLIHKNDFCRDIAIWYDEFLVPGENFNEAIAAALDKSSLFALAVTPNLINESNYVRNIEYPMAKDSGKIIIPAEMVPTDRTELARQYQDLPQCVDAGDEAQLTRTLLDAVQALALQQNDSDPEHNFFIGLAYLSGIDVEVDRERAVALITGSAEAGLPEAITKISRMYRDGDGVERDYWKSKRWMDKLAKYWEQKLEEVRQTGGDILPAAEELFQALWTLCYLEDDMDVLTDKDAMRLLQAAKHFDDPEKNSIAYDYCGRAYFKNGDYTAALPYFEQMLTNDRQLAEADSSPVNLNALSTSYSQIARLYGVMGESQKKWDSYEQALQICKKLAEENPTIKYRTNYAVSLLRFSDKFRTPEQISSAVAYCREALDLAKEMAKENDADSQLSFLAQCHYAYGNILMTCDRRNEAWEQYKASYELRKPLVKKLKSVSERKNCADVIEAMGYCCILDNNLKRAATFYRGALSIREELISDTLSRYTINELATCSFNLGVVSKNLKDMERGRNLWSALCKNHPQVKYYSQRLEHATKYIADFKKARGID